MVEGLSFDVAEGECVGLVGQSGAGKTTVARCLAGLHPVDQGRLVLRGHELASLLRHRPPGQRHLVQLVSQDPGSSLNPRRTVASTLVRPQRRLHGVDHGTAVEQARLLLRLVGLPPHVAGRLPGQLSGGEAQRVAVARGLSARPDVLVCDEITSALDAGSTATVMDLLDELRQRLRLALVFVTHDHRLLDRHADRVIVLGSVAAPDGVPANREPRPASRPASREPVRREPVHRGKET